MSKEQIDKITVHNDTEIKGFFGEYRWLSNYHMCPVVYKGLEFTSSEAAYQSAKHSDPYVISLFQRMEPDESKKASRKYIVPASWVRKKNNVMYEVLLDKFTRNSDLKEKLLATGERYLEETNYWEDTHFGVCNGKGKNYLGLILMKIRDEIRHSVPLGTLREWNSDRKKGASAAF